MTEAKEQLRLGDEQDEIYPRLREFNLPDDPAEQRELLDQLTSDGFSLKMNAGQSRSPDFSEVRLPAVEIDYLKSSARGRNYPAVDSNLIDKYGADNVARVMDARLLGSADADVDPYFVSEKGAYALFAREAEQALKGPANITPPPQA